MRCFDQDQAVARLCARPKLSDVVDQSTWIQTQARYVVNSKMPKFKARSRYLGSGAIRIGYATCKGSHDIFPRDNSCQL
jgi:hypothetical protein